MLTVNILLYTLPEKPERKLDGNKYSHTPDKLFCTPSVHSQPPAVSYLPQELLYHVITGENLKVFLPLHTR